MIRDFIKSHNLEKSLILGFYGGGNYGDELLLEILLNLLSKEKVRELTIAYQTPSKYKTYHADFGYALVDMHDIVAVIKSVFKNKSIIIGGGGLWGRDINWNVFALSLMLFLSRFILRKKVYLIGVGYYKSTTKLGHVSAWLAGKSATKIIARDDESFANFSRYSGDVSLSRDIAFNLPDLDLRPYIEDYERISSKLNIDNETVFLTIRRLKSSYSSIVDQFVAKESSLNIIAMILEPKEVDPEGYAQISRWSKEHDNVQSLDFSYNPMVVYMIMKNHAKNLKLVGPQFHVILTAYLCNVQFLPIVYDNKVSELIKAIDPNIKQISIDDLVSDDISSFIHDSKKVD